MPSKALKKLLDEWDEGEMTGTQLAERAYALGRRERGKRVMKGWTYGCDCTWVTVNKERVDLDQFRVEVIRVPKGEK